MAQSTETSSKPKPFRLVDLPPEIRRKIYLLLTIPSSSSTYINLSSPTAHSTFPLNLLLVSSQLYHEVRSLYFSHNAFSLSLSSHPSTYAYFLTPEFRDNRLEMARMQITLLRFGTKDFFTETLVPMLEDCILNGHLRQLGIKVREKWLISVREQEEKMEQGQRRGGDRNWKALKGVLEDPYLEQGKTSLVAASLKDGEEGIGGLRLDDEVDGEECGFATSVVWKVVDWRKREGDPLAA